MLLPSGCFTCAGNLVKGELWKCGEHAPAITGWWAWWHNAAKPSSRSCRERLLGGSMA